MIVIEPNILVRYTNSNIPFLVEELTNIFKDVYELKGLGHHNFIKINIDDKEFLTEVNFSKRLIHIEHSYAVHHEGKYYCYTENITIDKPNEIGYFPKHIPSIKTNDKSMGNTGYKILYMSNKSINGITIYHIPVRNTVCNRNDCLCDNVTECCLSTNTDYTYGLYALGKLF